MKKYYYTYYYSIFFFKTISYPNTLEIRKDLQRETNSGVNNNNNKRKPSCLITRIHLLLSCMLHSVVDSQCILVSPKSPKSHNNTQIPSVPPPQLKLREKKRPPHPPQPPHTPFPPPLPPPPLPSSPLSPHLSTPPPHFSLFYSITHTTQHQQHKHDSHHLLYFQTFLYTHLS